MSGGARELLLYTSPATKFKLRLNINVDHQFSSLFASLSHPIQPPSTTALSLTLNKRETNNVDIRRRWEDKYIIERLTAHWKRTSKVLLEISFGVSIRLVHKRIFSIRSHNEVTDSSSTQQRPLNNKRTRNTCLPFRSPKTNIQWRIMQSAVHFCQQSDQSFLNHPCTLLVQHLWSLIVAILRNCGQRYHFLYIS